VMTNAPTYDGMTANLVSYLNLGEGHRPPK
jgi:penicillin V acylase-like amidase (Ntn superfamily)